MRKYVIMGVQGSGKGTQSELLCDDLDLVHISVGDIFRWHVQHHTKLGAQVRRTMHAGELVGDDLDGVIHLELPDHEVRRRVLSRRLCPNCGMDYNLIADRPAVEGRCDICGHELTTRPDDTPEALDARLRDYHEKTRPVLELFQRKEVVHDVDARPAPEDVQAAIRKALNLPPYMS